MVKWKEIDWKAVGNAIIETMRSIGRGDILLRMRVDKLFPFILYTFALALTSIWLSYKADQTMYRVEINKQIIENLKIDNDVLIIIALIFLLSTEETDELLLLALVYIMF